MKKRLLYWSLAICLFWIGRSLLSERERRHTEMERKEVENRAHQGDAAAQYKLGILYDRGHLRDDKKVALRFNESVDERAQKAAEWFEKAATQGNVYAQKKLGLMYLSYPPFDEAKGFEWCRKAALQGDDFCQYEIGRLYETGKGIPKDETKAVEWYQKAAANRRMFRGDHGLNMAQVALGHMYEQGRGVPKDETRAFEWYEKAAIQGDRDALFAVGFMYANGKGVPQDNVRAYVFYERAASSSRTEDYFCQFSEEMERKLTLEQKGEAEELSAELDRKIGWVYPRPMRVARSSGSH